MPKSFTVSEVATPWLARANGKRGLAQFGFGRVDDWACGNLKMLLASGLCAQRPAVFLLVLCLLVQSTKPAIRRKQRRRYGASATVSYFLPRMVSDLRSCEYFACIFCRSQLVSPLHRFVLDVCLGPKSSCAFGCSWQKNKDRCENIFFRVFVYPFLAGVSRLSLVVSQFPLYSLYSLYDPLFSVHVPATCFFFL